MDADNVQSTVRLSLGSLQGTLRAERALQLLANAMRCESGFLYLTVDGVSQLAAQLGQPTPLPEMEELVAQCLRESDLDGTTKKDADASGHSDVRSPALTPVLLSHPSRGGISVSGVALLTRAHAMRTAAPALVHALSHALSDAHDPNEQDGDTTTATSPART
jgi:hypothetical protein